MAAIPIAATLGMRGLALEDGLCEMVVPRHRQYDGVFESFHGGLLMTIADSAACFAVLTLTGAEQTLTTTDMNIRFLAPCLTDVRPAPASSSAGARFVRWPSICSTLTVHWWRSRR